MLLMGKCHKVYKGFVNLSTEMDFLNNRAVKVVNFLTDLISVMRSEVKWSYNLKPLTRPSRQAGGTDG